MSEIPPGIDPAAQPIPGIAPEVDLGPEAPAAGPTTVFHGDRSVTYTQPQVTTPHLQAADYPSNSGIYNKEDAARAAGYPWGEIDRYLGPAQVAAQDAGYTQDEINQYLGYASPDAMVSRNTTAWAQVQHYDPKTLQPTSDGALDLTANPNWKGDYASALLRGEVKGPKDFADQYAASALNAAGASGQLLMAGVVGADKLAAQLPSRRDLTDGALSLGGAFEVAKQNLMDHWQETGQPPLDAAIKAQTDPALNAKLTTQPPPDLPWWAQGDPEAQTAAAVSEAIAPALSDAFHRYSEWRFAQPDANVKWGDWKEQLKSNPDDLVNIAAGLGGNIERVGATLADAIKSTPELLETLKKAIDRMPEPKTDVIDLSKPPGEAVTQAPVSEAVAPVKAAVRQKPEPVAEGAPTATATAVEEKPLPFEETATPAEKIEALAQDALGGNTKANMADVLNAKADQLETMRLTREGHLPDEFDRPNFFQDLAANEDPPTQELAKGYDIAASLRKFFYETIPDVLRDPSGTLPLTTPETPPRFNYRMQTGAAEDAINKFIIGPTNVQEKFVGDVLDKYRTVFAPHMKEWEDSLDAIAGGHQGTPPQDTVIGKFIGHMQGVPGVTLEKSNPFTPAANELRALNQWTHDWMQNAVDTDAIKPVGYQNDYFRQWWTKPNEADRLFGSGRTGSKSGTLPKRIPNWFDGLSAGLIPHERDPLKLVFQDISGKLRMVNHARFLKTAEEDGYIRPAEASVPDDVKLNWQGKELYAEPGYAKIYNRWANMRDLPPALENVANRLAYIKNTAVGVHLLLPLYHAWTVTKEVAGGSYAEMARLLAGGELGRAAQVAGETAAFPLRLARIARRAQDFNKRYFDYGALAPGEHSTDPVMQALVDAGVYSGPRQAIYRAGSAPNIQSSVLAGRSLTQYLQDFGESKQVLGTLANDIRNDWRPAVRFDADGKTIVTPRSALAIPGLALHELGRVITSVGGPLFDTVIPAIKNATNMEAVETILRQNIGNPDRAFVAKRIRQVIKNTDDRLGEMNQESLFWPRWARLMANASMLSTGWAYGTIRWTAAALGIRGISRGGGIHMEWNPTATYSMMGLAAASAAINTLYQRVKTGQWPQRLLDLEFPHSVANQPGRVMTPGQDKEMVDWAKIVLNTISAGKDNGWGAASIAATTGLYGYATGKEYGVPDALRILETGQNPIGLRPGYMPNGMWGGGGLPEMMFGLIAPIFLENANQVAASLKLNPLETAIGIREAPKWAENWNAWRMSQEKLHREWTSQMLARARHQAQVTGVLLGQ